MALTQSTTIADSLSLLLAKPLTSSINWSSTLLHLLPVVTGTGKNVPFTAELSAGTDASASSEMQRRSYTDADNEAQVQGSLNWAKYDKVAGVTGMARAVVANTARSFDAQSATGAGLGGSIMANRIRTNYGRMLRGIASDLYGGNETSTPVEVGGLERIIDSTGTYAGISQSSYGEWASVEDTEALSSLTFSVIRKKLLTPIYDACGEVPTFLVMPSDIFDNVKDLFGSTAVPYVREIAISAPTVDGSTTQDRMVALGAGMEAFSIDGVPCLRDRDCTSDTIYGVNTKYLYLSQLMELPEALLVDDAAITEALRQASGNATMRIAPQVIREIRAAIRNPTGVLPFFKQLGATGDSDEVLIKAYVQSACTRRNAHGKLTLTH